MPVVLQCRRFTNKLTKHKRHSDKQETATSRALTVCLVRAILHSDESLQDTTDNGASHAVSKLWQRRCVLVVTAH